MAPLSEQEMNAHLAEESRVCEVLGESLFCSHKSLKLHLGCRLQLHWIYLHVVCPAEIQKWVQHQPGLDRNLQICQEIQEPGKVVLHYILHRFRSEISCSCLNQPLCTVTTMNPFLFSFIFQRCLSVYDISARKLMCKLRNAALTARLFKYIRVKHQFSFCNMSNPPLEPT